MTDDFLDAAIVGSGPAGATCALALARAGLRVALIDKTAPPRYKTCGGGLVTRAREMLDLEIAPVVEQECHVAEMRFLDSDLHYRVERDRPLVSMTMRADLDERLLLAAVDAGARFMAPCELKEIDTTADGLRLATGSGSLRARYVIAADGAFSPTARAAGWSEHVQRVPAIESEIHVGSADFRRLGSSALFDVGVPTHGYAWVFPKREHLSVGCLSLRRGAHELKTSFADYLDRIGIREVESRVDHGYAIPVAPRSDVLARDRVLLTGDAAGLADPVTCEGISHAISSGRLAAQAIVQGGPPDRVHRTYHKLLEREILPELRLARMLARMLYERARLRLAIFRRAGRPLVELVAEIIAGRQSYCRTFSQPANYFRLALAVARGSYAAG